MRRMASAMVGSEDEFAAVHDFLDAAAHGLSALVFALRRLGADRVRLLLARRVVEGARRSELEPTR
jgi:hypothetical protein